MQIFIIVNSNKHILLTVQPTDRILYLKAKINEQLGIPLNQQQIVYQGKSLNNENTLRYYSISDDSALHLKQQIRVSTTEPKTIRIFIKDLSGSHITLFVDPLSRIEEIKELISERVGLTPCQQRLLFAGRQLEDKNTLQDYFIAKDSTIHLIRRLVGGKPVIYLYPEQDNFDVSVNIDMKKEDGEITSIYPVIKGNEKNTWIVKANRNGEFDLILLY